MIQCAICGVTYKRKVRRECVCWTCRQHDWRSDYCSAKGFPETAIYEAFIRMHNKLFACWETILCPVLLSMQKLSQKQSTNANTIHIYQDLAKIREQEHVLASLRTKGFLNETKYLEQSAELQRKTERIKRKLQRTSLDEKDSETLMHLEMLIDYFMHRKSRMIEFEPDAFHEIVTVISAGGKELTFHLIGGLQFSEPIL